MYKNNTSQENNQQPTNQSRTSEQPKKYLSKIDNCHFHISRNLLIFLKISWRIVFFWRISMCSYLFLEYATWFFVLVFGGHSSAKIRYRILLPYALGERRERDQWGWPKPSKYPAIPIVLEGSICFAFRTISLQVLRTQYIFFHKSTTNNFLKSKTETYTYGINKWMHVCKWFKHIFTTLTAVKPVNRYSACFWNCHLLHPRQMPTVHAKW